MKIDLEQALSDLARSVHDDDVTDRMNGQVRTMVGRIRRRRAARHTATGVVSLGAVAGLTVGAAQLWDRGATPAPPATDGPVEPAPHSSSDGLSLECGDRVPADTLRPESEGFRLELEVDGPAADGDVPAVVRLVNGGDTTFDWDTDPVVQLAALRDGEVVATGTIPASRGVFSPGDVWQADRTVSLSTCEGEGQFGAGDYELVASVIFANADGSDRLGLSAGLAALTITAAEPEPDEVMADIIAASDRISAEYPFGTCGTRVPVDQDVPFLQIDVDLGPGPYPAGSLIEGSALIRATEGLTVLANAPATSAHVVLTRDGVVVGRGDYDPEHISMIEFGADTPYPLPALGNALLCPLPGENAPELDLPPGTYQAYTTLEVALKEVQYPDGTAESYSHIEVARSAPVDVVIE